MCLISRICQECAAAPPPAGLAGLLSRGTQVVMGREIGQPQHPPERGPGLWVLQLRNPSSSHGWDITLVTGLYVGDSAGADSENVSFLHRLQRCGDLNGSSCVEVNTGTTPRLLFRCNKVMWEVRRKSTWLHEMFYDGTIWIYCKRHGHP